ncbi:MAG: hypothetical protein IKO15_03865, partial [Clostridiales bacterium]|nr:hypothetical protein [Clostridiales bacterium]
MKKVIASVLSVAMVAALAAGCTQPTDPTTGSETSGGVEPVETGDVETEPVETEPETTEKQEMTIGTGSEVINLWSFTDEIPK